MTNQVLSKPQGPDGIMDVNSGFTIAGDRFQDLSHPRQVSVSTTRPRFQYKQLVGYTIGTSSWVEFGRIVHGFSTALNTSFGGIRS